MVSPLDPSKAVAAYDSASVLHAATVAAVEHRPFPHLGNPPIMGPIVRAVGRLPWSILRGVYSRIGGAEGLDPGRLGQIDSDAIAASFADAYPARPHPAVFVGSANGALTHLAGAMAAPWLPSTVLIPVSRRGEADRPDEALEFGRRVAPAMLAASPQFDLHQMHDPAQDELMTARVAYFRVKWNTLPEPYARFLAETLEPGAPLVVVDDTSTWPVTRVGERHVFQTGGAGWMSAEQHLQLPHAPVADEVAREAEWGAPTGFVEAAVTWAKANGHPVVRVSVDGPQAAAHPVAEVLRDWTRRRGGAADQLLVPSFVLGDPWRTFQAGLVPFWTYFPTRDVVASLDEHLARVDPYRRVEILMFQHGADSPGRARPEDFERVVRRHGAQPHLLALHRDAVPHDIGALGRFTPALRRLEDGPPFLGLQVRGGLDELEVAARGTGLHVDAD